MRIKKRQNGCIIELDDGSAWRVWPDDVERVKGWTHSTKLTIYKFNGGFCTHVLFDRMQGKCVRVIDAKEHWPSEIVPQRNHAPIAA